MKNKQPSKFAYLACNPDKDENPIMDAEALRLELGSSQALNLTLSTPNAKNNPTGIAIKYLKFLKENYFDLAASLNLYNKDKLVSDHYLFLCAFSPDAAYSNLQEFRSHLLKKYGEVEFIPLSLSDDEALKLTLLSELRDLLMNLYSIVELDPKKRGNAINKYLPLLNIEDQEKLIDSLDSQKRNRKVLDHLVSRVNEMKKCILTNRWV